MARRATAISRLRQEAQGTVLVLDSGNSLFPSGTASATSDPSKGALPVEAMNAMQYDALALGSGDLAYGADVVLARFEEAEFAILSANVGPAGQLPHLQPYLLRQVDGHTVAIIGATSSAAAQPAEALGLGLRVGEVVDAVRGAVEEVQGQAEIVIVLSNLEGATNRILAAEVPGIDAIIGARGGGPVGPQAVPGPEGQVVLHASGVRGESLGQLVLHFDGQGRVASFSGQVRALTADYADDPEVVQIMQRYGVRP